RNCDGVNLPFAVDLDAKFDTNLQHGRAQLQVHALHTEIRADLRLGGTALDGTPLADGELDAKLFIDAPELPATAKSLRPFLDAETRARLSGSTRLDLSCRGPLEPLELRCAVSTDVSRVDAIERLQLALTTRLTSARVDVDISRL